MITFNPNIIKKTFILSFVKVDLRFEEEEL